MTASCSHSVDFGIGGKTERTVGQVLLDPDHGPECCGLTCARPDACHPDKDSYDLWLDPGMQNVAAISELLKPYDARLMRSYPVSTRINSVVNDDAECSAPAKLVEIQTRLF
jgi:hypothetical protein